MWGRKYYGDIRPPISQGQCQIRRKPCLFTYQHKHCTTQYFQLVLMIMFPVLDIAVATACSYQE